MKTQDGDALVFYITEDSVQEISKRIVGRELTDEEIYSVKKGIEWGITWDLDTIISTAIMNAVNKSSFQEVEEETENEE